MIDGAPRNLNANSIKTAKAIWEWNKVEGNRKIRYCSGIGAYAYLDNDLSIIESEAKKLWERYVNMPRGTEEDHVYIDGKPLMVIFETTEEQWNNYTGDKTYTDKFTLRFAVGHAYDPGMWGWVIPQTHVTEDVATLVPGWYKFNHPLEKVYRNHGESYQKSWETILAAEIVPNFIVINSFNEYVEHTAVFTADTSLFPSDYPIEQWTDAEGNAAPSLYWDITKEYIAKYKNCDRK